MNARRLIERKRSVGTKLRQRGLRARSLRLERLERRDLLALSQPLLNFPGQDQVSATISDPTIALTPPDTVGDVGPSHFVQMVNALEGSHFTVYSKTNGTVLFGPEVTSSLAPATSLCRADPIGDPIVLYDHFADRWLMSEIVNPGTANALCVYISETSNPANNRWHAYEFPVQQFPDYPKYAVTEEAYFVTTNEVVPAVYALDRENMLLGLPALPPQRFVAPARPFSPFDVLTPADVDGPAPPEGAPALMMYEYDDEHQTPAAADPLNDFLVLFEFHVDFEEPRLSTFREAERIPIPDFDSDLCIAAGTTGCIPQPGTGATLDGVPETIMQRLQYRNFGTHETLVGNFTIDTDGFDRAGIQWFELRKNGPTDRWHLHQGGQYAPDAQHRFMGAIAMDGDGNIAMGYNVSSALTSPSIRYTGRHADDPLGFMSGSEINAVTGQGFLAGGRWGDYNSLSVDPTDDRTFWFTGEYVANGQWATQVVSMRFEPDEPTEPPVPPPVDGRVSTIAGIKFLDRDGDGTRDANEPGVGGIMIYLDTDGDSRADLGEPAAFTHSDGRYTLSTTLNGTFFLREVVPLGATQTLPGTSELGYEITLPLTEDQTFDFGNQTLADFGDAPAPYPTLAAQNGAVHTIVPGFHLGATVDDEADGQPTLGADGDDLNGVDDEDGVSFGTLMAGSSAQMQVAVSHGSFAPGLFNAWIDYNADGDWNDAGEHVVQNRSLQTGSHTLDFNVPALTDCGDSCSTYARVRYGQRQFSAGSAPTGGDTAGEVEDYRVQILASPEDAPVAVDDTFTVAAGATTQHMLNVLANDLPDDDPSLRVTSVSPSSQGGTVTIGSGGQDVQYRAPAGFTGIDRFTYTIQNSSGQTATAPVNVQVGDNTKSFGFRLQTTNLSGSPISAVSAGSTFQLRLFIQDLRSPDDGDGDPLDERGIFAAYTDILYDSNLVSTIADPLNPLGFQVTFAAEYPNQRAGDDDTPNLINELGAFQGSIMPTGPDEILLATINLTADSAGTAVFQLDPADVSPLHDSLFFEPDDQAVPNSLKVFASTSLTIGGGGGAVAGEGEPLTNPMNRFDVNDDGFVSPIDPLLVVNHLNVGLNSAEGEQSSQTYLDVSGDGTVSPIDVLQLINYLNEDISGEGEAAPPLARPVTVLDAQSQETPSTTPLVLAPSVFATRERGSSTAAPPSPPVSTGLQDRAANTEYAAVRSEVFARWEAGPGQDSASDDAGDLLSEETLGDILTAWHQK